MSMIMKAWVYSLVSYEEDGWVGGICRYSIFLSVFLEGVNGQLPNLDLINTICVVAQNTARIPFTLHDDIDSNNAESGTMASYWNSLKHVLRTMEYQVVGHPSSNAGQYLR